MKWKYWVSWMYVKCNEDSLTLKSKLFNRNTFNTHLPFQMKCEILRVKWTHFQGLGNLLVIRYLPSDLFKKRQNNDNFYKFPRHEYRGKSSKTGLNTVEKNQITSVLWFLLGMRMNFIKISQFCFWHTEIVCCWFLISR